MNKLKLILIKHANELISSILKAIITSIYLPNITKYNDTDAKKYYLPDCRGFEDVISSSSLMQIFYHKIRTYRVYLLCEFFNA